MLGNLIIFLNNVVNHDTLQWPALKMQVFLRLSHLTIGLQIKGQPAELGHIISILKQVHLLITAAVGSDTSLLLGAVRFRTGNHVDLFI